ncbi:MAG: hypothetical protein Q4P33_07140 [Flaviflexus sp.]|nr:hypothetical protein [Flaviflexus sp.]
MLETTTGDVCFIAQVVADGEPSATLAGACGEPASVPAEGIAVRVSGDGQPIVAVLLPTSVDGDSLKNQAAEITDAYLDEAGENCVITAPASVAGELEQMKLKTTDGADLLANFRP